MNRAKMLDPELYASAGDAAESVPDHVPAKTAAKSAAKPVAKPALPVAPEGLAPSSPTPAVQKALDDFPAHLFDPAIKLRTVRAGVAVLGTLGLLTFAAKPLLDTFGGPVPEYRRDD